MKEIPCPFCGISDCVSTIVIDSNSLRGAAICGNCKCLGPEVQIKWPDQTSWKQEALKKWRKRKTKV